MCKELSNKRLRAGDVGNRLLYEFVTKDWVSPSRVLSCLTYEDLRGIDGSLLRARELGYENQHLVFITAELQNLAL